MTEYLRKNKANIIIGVLAFFFAYSLKTGQFDVLGFIFTCFAMEFIYSDYCNRKRMLK